MGVERSRVVAPSLTPEGYNRMTLIHRMVRVVAPSLTPEGYNPRPQRLLGCRGCSSLSHPGRLQSLAKIETVYGTL